MTWTQFWDMHSGGGIKEEPFHYIYIEAPEKEAKVVFYNRFSHNPDRVSCTCCGEDYAIEEYEDLAQASAYHRNCKFDSETDKYIEKQGNYGSFVPFDVWVVEAKDKLLICADGIKPEEKVGEVPTQGYVWK